MKLKLINRKGFTLVELIVVISIISVLVGITSIKIVDLIEYSKISAWKFNHRMLESAIVQYISQNYDQFPNDISELKPYIVGESFLENKPKGASYYIDAPNGVLTSTLTGLRVPLPPLVFKP